LSRAMDLFSFKDLSRRLGNVTSLSCPNALVIGVQEDHLFPIQSQQAVGQALRDLGVAVQFESLSSPYGHDAFLTEKKPVFAPLKAVFGDHLTLFIGATTDVGRSLKRLQ